MMRLCIVTFGVYIAPKLILNNICFLSFHSWRIEMFINFFSNKFFKSYHLGMIGQVIPMSMNSCFDICVSYCRNFIFQYWFQFSTKVLSVRILTDYDIRVRLYSHQLRSLEWTL